MGTDGHGITTLVAFHGCPLKCKYCLNPQCLKKDAKILIKTPEEVMEILLKDELYFLATKGGVTFGGGEPLLRAEFIKEVLELGAKQWRVTIETSLNVPKENLELLIPYVDEYFVDVKDMDPILYEKYTGCSNYRVIENLRYLADKGIAGKVVCRVPSIPRYNNFASQFQSISELRKIGFSKFDKFEYSTLPNKHSDMSPSRMGIVF